MVKKTYFKTVLRLFKGNAARFSAIAALNLISVAVVTGIGGLAPRMRRTFDAMREAGRMRDLAFVEGLADRIETISYIFPAFFAAVVCLVVYMTVSRLIKSRRAHIGCYKTLGYPNRAPIIKYVLFVASACLLGCAAGLLIGFFALLPVLYSVIESQFELPAVKSMFPVFGFAAAAALLLFSFAVAFAVAYRAAKEKPASLFLPEAPKAGGKILLERMPFIWNRLKFRYKSTLRNIFRYKTRFVMTVFSALGSAALLFSGLALYVSLFKTNPDIMDMIGPISVVLIVSAVLLNTVVIHNITNINIDERKREVATLMVLGYRNIEVVGYIFRELFLIVLTGALLGLPAGFGFMNLIFGYLDFGGTLNTPWYIWFSSVGLSLVSLGIADLLLFKKIHKVDMNGSLKEIE